MNTKLIVTAMVIALSGCAAMRSPTPDTRDSALGAVYYLPKAYIMFTVTVDEKGEQLMVEAAPPEYVGDPSAAYTLTSVINPFGSDDIVISVGADGLLTSVNLKATGELDESLVAAAKSAGKVSKFLEFAQREDKRKVVFQEYIDPQQLINQTDINQFNERIKKSLGKISAKNEEVKAAKDGLNIKVKQLIKPSAGVILSSGLGNGIYYRRLIPYTITAEVGGLQQEKMFQVPNGSPTYMVEMLRGAFSDWNTDVAFEKGMLTKFDHDHKSEAAELFALPGELVGGFVEGITEGFQSKTSVIEAEGKYLDSKVAFLEKKKQASEKIKESEASPKLEAAIKDKGNPLFSFVYGKDNFQLVPPGTVNKDLSIPELSGSNPQPPPLTNGASKDGPSNRTRSGSPGM